MELPEPDLLVEVAPGRFVAVDDRGDPGGAPVLYLHGTPDSRLSRHPDDLLAAEAGVRLLAVDRPGVGRSDPDPSATPLSAADDLAAVLGHLDIAEVGVLSWSAGSISAMAFGGRHPTLVRSLTLVAPLVPADAYSDAGVLDGADDSRQMFASMLDQASPDELGQELAMWLVPPEIDDATARSMLETTLETVDAHVGDQLVTGLIASVAAGMSGIEREVASQAIPLGGLLDSITAPVSIHVGTADQVTPVAMAKWIAARLGADLTEHAGAGHSLAITMWQALLTNART